MKKILLLMAVTLFCCTAFAQEIEIEKSKSKTVEFMVKEGSLMKKEYYELDKVKGIDVCRVLIVTDLISNEKKGCLLLTTGLVYTGVIDQDEIGACMRSIAYIKDNLLPKKPSMQTEVNYLTRDKVAIGANYEKRNWSAFIQTKPYTLESISYFSTQELKSLLNMMTQAQKLIEEKTK